MAKKAVKMRTPKVVEEKPVSRVRWSPEEQAALVDAAAAALKTKEVFSLVHHYQCFDGRACLRSAPISDRVGILSQAFINMQCVNHKKAC